MDVDTIGLVVDKFLMELDEQLNAKGVALHVEKTARTWLSKNGYDASMGARPMARLIQEKIKKPLADELLFGSLVNGGTVTLSVKNDNLHFVCQDHREGVC